jgi:subtilisin family serine protease
MRRAALAAVVLALAVPSSAAAGRFAVGLERGASPAAVAERVRQVSGGTVSTIAPFALALQARSARRVATVPGVAYVERLNRSRRLSFTPTDPLVKRQWYLDTINAFDYWPQLPVIRAPVYVAVIDSGIDGSHPEFDGRIKNARSFVDNQPRKDAEGHGTFVAGVIAAAANNAQGIAGIGFPVELLVGKVVRADGTISPEAEAKAIRWAVDRGAQVINLSLGGTRDPHQPARDTFSFLEAAAIDYAVQHDVVVVAAVGNGDQAPSFPWGYANYPAALAHVIGVSAVARDGGSVPTFSNSDAVYNDVSAPGEDILSTLPRALTEPRPLCEEQGYSSCGSKEFKRGDGTSFAAPQVSAAAALMLSEEPSLEPEQVSLLLRQSVEDVTQLTCRQCDSEHDAYSGWGRLDVTEAVRRATQGVRPRTDQFEPNDEAGHRAASLGRRKPLLRLQATLDYWDDRTDVYRIRLKRGERFSARVNGLPEVETNLRLFRPGTRALQRRLPGSTTRAVRRTRGYGFVRRLRPYRAVEPGWHYLEVKMSAEGWGRYALEIRR